MSQDIQIKRGLDLKLVGEAEKRITDIPKSKIYTLKPSDFHLVTPKMVVKEGDSVKEGEVVFYAKHNEDIKFVSPVSGKIVEIKRGAKRVILEIKIEASSEESVVDFGVQNIASLSSAEAKTILLQSGAWPFVKQRPYDVMANPNDEPKAIFVSVHDTAPLAADPHFVVDRNPATFQAGIDVLKKLTKGKVYLGIDAVLNSSISQIKGVELLKLTGPHPIGNVGIQINKVDPINSGERVWTLGAQDVAIIGNLFLTGKLNLTRTFALVGSSVKTPQYYRAKIGSQLSVILNDKIETENVRVISGDVLTGKKVSTNDSLGFYNTTISVIPEGNQYRMFGWLPFVDNHIHSASRTSLASLFSGKKFTPNTNLNGEERALVVTGEMEKVMPMDIFPMQLLKACMIQDIEKMENLGIYEVAPEDFALIDYTNTSKIEAQEIIREALDLMIKEVG